MRQDVKESLALALDTLRTHKLRSFLTVLGVVIGVAVIIVVASLMAGFDENVTEAISGFGADTIAISKISMGPRFGRLSKEERMRKPLTPEDGEAILQLCPSVKAVATSIFTNRGGQRMRYKDKEVLGMEFRGTFPDFMTVYANAAMKEGRFFTAAENHHRQMVVVIGQNIAEALFPNVAAVGKEVLIDGSTYLVVGVFEMPKGGFGGDNEDRRVVIPYWTFRKIYTQAEEHFIRAQAFSGQIDVAVDQIREVLRRRRNVKFNEPDSFGIQTSQQAVEQFHSIVFMVAAVTFAMSSIGLLVGGVGVMNIMLVSVTERTREIGVRKAIGAKRGDIRSQFLLEAMTLTGIGGLIGILFATGVAMLVSVATSWNAVVPMWAVALGITVSVGIGLVFGVWPAMKAARLDPVEALRYE
jgi:ABC-type antimicrobial peptide transport system permease subunit